MATSLFKLEIQLYFMPATPSIENDCSAHKERKFCLISLLANQLLMTTTGSVLPMRYYLDIFLILNAMWNLL